MSRKLSRCIYPGRKIGLSDNRPLPEAVDEFPLSNYHPFGEKVETLSLTELKQNLPIVHSVTSQDNLQATENFNQPNSYYEHNDTDDGSNIWDEYWFPCESESSDLSQSAASFMSWSDEIEVETTRKLQQFYDALESFLYDEAPPPENVGPELMEECLLWKSKFPHIRVVGKAILPPPDFRVSSGVRNFEEIIAIDEYDSDEETIQGSPEPSFLELDDAAERLVYDDVTMGTRCEGDCATLRGKVHDCVMEGLFAYVAARMEESREGTPHRVPASSRERTVEQEETLSPDGSYNQKGDSNWARNENQDRSLKREKRRNLEGSSSQKRTLDRERNSSGDWISYREGPSSQLDHRIGERSVTAASVTSDAKMTPRVANSSSSSRLAVGAAVNVHFEPSESRAYHSAAIRVQSKETAARRLHSFGGHDGKPGNFPSRQDAILRELRESQLRLSGNGTGNGDGIVREKPRSKTWSGGRHNVLPPLEVRARERDKPKTSPRTVSPLRIEVNGTRLTRAEPKEVSLKKYTPLGSTNAKVTSDGRKLGRL